MGCGTSTIKYLLFIFNLVFALGGLAILICGAIIQYNISFYNEFLTAQVSVPPILLIVVGSIIFVIAFFGCCGAIRESHCMVITFAVMLLVIFIVQIIGGVLAFVYRSEVEEGLRTSMRDLLKNYQDPSNVPRQAWDSMQEDLKCCGVDSPFDWTIFGQQFIPESCKCVDPTNSKCDLLGNYSTGCYTLLRDFIKVGQTVLGAIAIAIAGVELIGVICALCLASSIKKADRMMT